MHLNSILVEESIGAGRTDYVLERDIEKIGEREGFESLAFSGGGNSSSY
jgi:hypothetical protein